MQGVCHQRVGNAEAAAACYEESIACLDKSPEQSPKVSIDVQERICGKHFVSVPCLLNASERLDLLTLEIKALFQSCSESLKIMAVIFSGTGKLSSVKCIREQHVKSTVPAIPAGISSWTLIGHLGMGTLAGCCVGGACAVREPKQARGLALCTRGTGAGMRAVRERSEHPPHDFGQTAGTTRRCAPTYFCHVRMFQVLPMLQGQTWRKLFQVVWYHYAFVTISTSGSCPVQDLASQTMHQTSQGAGPTNAA